MNRLRPPVLTLCALALAALAVPSAAGASASAWSSNPQARARLLTSWQVAPRGANLRLGLHFRLAPGWHIYWKNPGDAGYPPAVSFQPPGLLGEPEVLFPSPHRFDLPGGLVSFGYQGEVVYPVVAPVLEKVGAAPRDVLSLTADVDYLVCKEVCIPHRAKLAVEQPLGDPAIPDYEVGALIDTWWARLPRTIGEVPGLSASASVDASRPEAPVFNLRLVGPTLALGGADLFFETQPDFEIDRPSAQAVGGGVVFRAKLKPRVQGGALPAAIPFAWTATGLQKGGETFGLTAKGEVVVGRRPRSLSAARGATGGRSEVFQAGLRAVVGGLALLATPAALALLVALLLGLRGAATPYPGDSAPAREGDAADRPGVRERAAAAATGALGGAWLLAGLAALARRGGVLLAWNLVEIEPVAAALAAALTLILALNLWGLLEAPLPAGAAGAAGAAGDRPAGTARFLVSGLLLAPLALGWPLALLRAPLTVAIAQGAGASTATLAAFGLGLAFPFLLLAAAPGFTRFLPEPGGRTDTLYRALGFLAAGGLVRLAYLLLKTMRPEGLAALELTLLAVALLAWLRFHLARGRASRALLALLIVLGLALAPWLAERFRYVPRTIVTPAGPTPAQGG